MQIKKIIPVVLLLCIPIAYFAYERGIFLPRWVEWHATDFKENIDHDETEERIVLKNRTLWIDEERMSEEGWLVSDVQIADIDRDDTKEILLLVWNQNAYGKYHPFWVEEKKNTFYQHLYIFSYANDKLKPFWMSSALHPNIKIMTIDNGILFIEDPDGEKSQWAWNEWGIERIDETNIPY